MSESNKCCEKCEKHVRDRSPIGSGSSRRMMTGVHVECKKPTCPCHSTTPSWEAEFNSFFEAYQAVDKDGKNVGSWNPPDVFTMKKFIQSLLDHQQAKRDTQNLTSVPSETLVQELVDRGYTKIDEIKS